jgi:hypothetical protein
MVDGGHFGFRCKSLRDMELLAMSTVCERVNVEGILELLRSGAIKQWEADKLLRKPNAARGVP